MRRYRRLSALFLLGKVLADVRVEVVCALAPLIGATESPCEGGGLIEGAAEVQGGVMRVLMVIGYEVGLCYTVGEQMLDDHILGRKHTLLQRKGGGELSSDDVGIVLLHPVERKGIEGLNGVVSLVIL